MKSITIYFFAAMAFILMAHSSGAGARQGVDRTGGPVADGFCSACHSGGEFNAAVNLTLLGESGDTAMSYIPGNTYTMRVEVTGGGASGYGFQAVALASDLAGVGSYGAPGAGSQITEIDGRQYFEHSSTSTNGSWEIEWMAPEQGIGEVKFFFAGNAVDGNNRNGGDQPVSDSLVMAQDETSSLARQADFGITIGPVPAVDYLRIDWNTAEQLTRVDILTLDGQLMTSSSILRGAQSHVVNVAELSSGMYILTLRSDQGFQSKRILVQ